MMKKVTFLKQGMENFCNHIEPMELEFGEGQLVLVTGPNGAGKTSLFQALPYTLYGQCEKGRGDDVLNDKTEKNCHTWTEFDIDGQGYRVDRYVKYTRLGNTVTLTRKGEKRPYKKGHKEVVPEVERLLVPYKLFMNTLLFSQKVKTFFTDLTDSQQKEIFRKILTLDDYVLYHQGAGVEERDIENRIIELIGMTSVNEQLLVDAEQQLKQTNQAMMDFYRQKGEEIETLTRQIEARKTIVANGSAHWESFVKQNLDDKLANVSSRIGFASQKFNNVAKELDAIVEKIESQAGWKEAELEGAAATARTKAEQELSEQRHKINAEWQPKDEEFEKERELLIHKKHSAEKQQASTHTEMLSTKKLIGELEESLEMEAPVCPTCLQDITDESKKKIQEQVDFAFDRMEKLRGFHEQLTEEIYEWDSKLSDLASKRNEWKEQKNKKIEKAVDENTKTLTSINARLQNAMVKLEIVVKEQKEAAIAESAKEKAKYSLQVDELQMEKDGVVKLIEAREEALRTLNESKSQLSLAEQALKSKEEEEFDKSLLKSLEEKIKECKKNIVDYKKNLEELREQKVMAEFWRKGFSPSGIQSMLIDDAIPFMNEKITHYMDKLSNGRYQVKFDTLKPTKDGKVFRDKIYVELFDTFTHSDARVKFSGGQERLVDIGTILTLCDLQSMIQDVEFNILLFDEIFDALDDNNIAQVANLIKRVSMNKWIGVISHRHIDQIEADEVLEFRG